MKTFLLTLALSWCVMGHADESKTYKTEHKLKHATGLKKHPHLEHWSHKVFGAEAVVTIPDKMDLRDKLTPIRDQGNCGSCWMFSTTAVHRDGHAINLGDKNYQALSEQDMDCVTTEGGCGGGYFDAFDFMMKGGKGNQGQHSLAQLPYTARDGRCNKTFPVVAYITGWHMIGAEGRGPSTQDIESIMVQTGKPVSITVTAGAGDWMNYSGGVYNGCRSGSTDHMIDIVGWDNEGETFNSAGNLPAGKGIWILRNSWGTGWGEQGWMRSKMTDSRGNKCNDVAEEAAYAEFDDVPPTPTPTPTPTPPVPDQASIPWWIWVIIGGLLLGLVFVLVIDREHN